MLITKTVPIKWRKDNKEWYESKGYKYTKTSDEFEVKVEDLPNGSHAEIKCLCDYCLETIIDTTYDRYNRTNTNSIIHKDCCSKCKGKKIKESNLIVYGIESVNQLQEKRDNVSNRRKAKKEDIELLCIERNFKLVEIYQDNKGATRIKYICLKHEYIGIQETNISTLKTSNGCRQCTNETNASITRLDGQYVFNEFIKAGYEPIFNPKDYKNAFQHLEYICPEHREMGVLNIVYNSLQRGSGCPYCSESKGEKRINEYLKNNNINFDTQYIYSDLLSDKGNNLRFDFAIFKDKELTKLITLIEYDGIQHFEWREGMMTEEEFEIIKYHDKLKEKYYEKNNIQLLRIPYTQFDNIEKILYKIAL